MCPQPTNSRTMPMNLDKFLNLLGCEIENTQNAIYNLKILAAKNIDPKNMNLRQRVNLMKLLDACLTDEGSAESKTKEQLQKLKTQLIQCIKERQLMQYTKARYNKFKIAFRIFYFLNFTALFVPLVLKHIYPQKTFFNYTSYLEILLSLFGVSTLFVCSYKLSSSFMSRVDAFICGTEFVGDKVLEIASSSPKS